MVSEKVSISQQVLVTPSNRSTARRNTQYLAALVVTIGGLIAGTCLAWTSPAETFLKHGELGFVVNDDAFAWIGSFMPLGAIIGSIITASLVDLVGRKNLLLTLTVSCIIGWMSIAFSISVLMMYIGRFLTGIATGSYCILAPMYTAEIGEKEIRGTLGTYLQLQITIGILLTYIVGSYMQLFWLTLFCNMIPVIFLFLMSLIPETPYFYLLKGDYIEAENSLAWFRGSRYDGSYEITAMKKSIEEDKSDQIPFGQAFRSNAAIRGLIIGLGIMFLQQFSGCNAVIFYASSIFKDANTSMDSELSTTIIGVLQVISTWVATVVVDKLGRRILLLHSIVIMTVSTFTLGLYFFLKDDLKKNVENIGWLPLLSLSIYIIIFSLGFGPIPWMLIAEIFPSKIKSSASSLACLFNWSCVFVITKLFPILKVNLGAGITFWCFSLCSTVGIFFVLFIVPETKGKTLLEVQEILDGRSRTRSSPLENNYAVNETFRK